MSETRKTIMFGGVALVLVLLAWVTAPRPVTPDQFTDQGEAFYPEFTDPTTATSLEVIDYDADTGTPIPFKVVNENGRWSIPSHHGYPADGADRLAETAASLIGITRDDFRTNNVADHAACGVIDPLDETATDLDGRGKRVTIRGENDKVLADYIFGKEVDGAEGFRFVRLPDQKAVYACRVDIDISTTFSDWIESDLLMVEKDDIRRITLRDYSINERTGTINNRDELVLTKDGDTWEANRMRADQEIQQREMTTLLTSVDELSIVGVRPKPAGLSTSLRKDQEGMEISQQDYLDLQNKGYFFARDGSLVSNEGEVQVRTASGIVYTLRFGEVAPGSGLALTAGTGDADGDAADNRYLFITAYFDEDAFSEPPAPANTDFLNTADSLWSDADQRNKARYDAHEDWKVKVEQGRQKADELRNRFADWYYVISADSFKKLRKTRSELVQEKKADA